MNTTLKVTISLMNHHHYVVFQVIERDEKLNLLIGLDSSELNTSESICSRINTCKKSYENILNDMEIAQRYFL